jgi:lactate dehydrogenase-like 2-hydroxyacid dehydrogenase
VADLGFGLLLDVMRRITSADRFLRAGNWAAGQLPPLSRRVSGAKLGMVGFGRIGQTIARRASGFDMAVRYHTRRPVADTAVAHEPSLLALQQGRIAGAGLDVFEAEPRVPHELLAMDQVVVQPHVASATHETRAAMAQRVWDNLDSFLTTGHLVSAAPLSASLQAKNQ